MNKVLVLGGSIRSQFVSSRQVLLDSVRDANDLPTYLEGVKHFDSSSRLSNTEILSGAAMLGAKSQGAEFDFFALARLFPRHNKPLHTWDPSSVGLAGESIFQDTLSIDEASLNELGQRVRDSAAILLASPVYFGDRSSVCDRFMHFAEQRGWLKGKLFAALSVGAKRNGGQETTNLYLLHEALTHGACVVGNGPPCSQYGGTAMAGDLGAVKEDGWGLKTCWETGARAAAATKRLSNTQWPMKDTTTAPHIVCLVTMDDENRTLASRLKEGIAESGVPAQFTVCELEETAIERCLACRQCPVPISNEGGEVSPDGCVIRTKRDSMESIHKTLIKADGILVAGMNVSGKKHLVHSSYQIFSERTRYIRRNDFELTDIPLAAYLMEEPGATTNRLFDLKVLTSYIRHNCLIMPPLLDTREVKSQVRPIPGLADFFDRVLVVTTNRRNQQKIEVSYKAVGYSDRRLDWTTAER